LERAFLGIKQCRGEAGFVSEAPEQGALTHSSCCGYRIEADRGHASLLEQPRGRFEDLAPVPRRVGPFRARLTFVRG
jgi:hypothetical protein